MVLNLQFLDFIRKRISNKKRLQTRTLTNQKWKYHLGRLSRRRNRRIKKKTISIKSCLRSPKLWYQMLQSRWVKSNNNPQYKKCYINNYDRKYQVDRISTRKIKFRSDKTAQTTLIAKILSIRNKLIQFILSHWVGTQTIKYKKHFMKLLLYQKSNVWLSLHKIVKSAWRTAAKSLVLKLRYMSQVYTHFALKKLKNTNKQLPQRSNLIIPGNYYYFYNNAQFLNQSEKPLVGPISKISYIDTKPHLGLKLQQIRCNLETGDFDAPWLVKVRSVKHYRRSTRLKKQQKLLLKLSTQRRSYRKRSNFKKRILNKWKASRSSNYFLGSNKNIRKYQIRIRKNKKTLQFEKHVFLNPLLFSNNSRYNLMILPFSEKLVRKAARLLSLSSRTKRRRLRNRSNNRRRSNLKIVTNVFVDSRKKAYVYLLYKKFVPSLRIARTTSYSKSLKTKQYIKQWLMQPYRLRPQTNLNILQKPFKVKRSFSITYSIKSSAKSKIKRKKILLNPKKSLTFTKQRSKIRYYSTASNNKNYPMIKTRSGKRFILQYLGLFVHQNTMKHQLGQQGFKYIFKKRIFSFVFPNEIRSLLLQKKKKITFYQLVFKNKISKPRNPSFNLLSYKQLLIEHYKLSTAARANYQQNFHSVFFGNFSNNVSTILNSKYVGYDNSQNEIIHNTDFTKRGVDLSYRVNEVRVPRIRFKPGYQRIWRNARTALKESLNLRFIYQKQLTRYLFRFYRSVQTYTFAHSEMLLGKVIMYARLLPDLPTITLFMSYDSVFLNGKPAYEPSLIVAKQDFLQLAISVHFYISYRWIANWTLKRHKKFKRLVYRKGLANKSKLIKLKKQKSYYTPNWIHLVRYDIIDVKAFLEVDYLTLSAFIIYEPFTFAPQTPDDAPDYRSNIYRLYNWKYIT